MAIDYQALFGDEVYDSCAALKALRPALIKLKVEGQTTRVSFRDRTVEFKAADLSALESLVSQLEGECAAANGRLGPRRAITAGARYR
ncbi:gpW family head-tail joining protein [Brucella sp. TWI432]